jgi:hypothetical protein
MLFKRDIFISYAHIDNMALKEGEKGWVADFHRALDVRLAQLLGEEPEIWRDQKLQGNDYFGDEIVEQFPKTAVMISVLSPRYIKSQWCAKEVREFYEAASKGLGTKIDNKSRIFKVIKTHVPYNAHPPEIADTLGYEFYISDPDTGKTKELNQKSGGELEQVYWAKLDDIAHDVCDLLEKLKQSGETGAVFRQEQNHLTVYLAETGSDLKKQRDMIKRELLEFGYGVLPDQRLPAVEAEFKPLVEQMLARCVLSIHLVGGSYGPVPEGSPKSIVPLQNELAARTGKSGKLQRLIWLLPADYKGIDDKRQEQFVHHLRTDPAAQYGADFFETAIEDFKFAIHDKLNSLKPSPTFVGAADTAAPGGPMTVYLAETNYELKDERESIKRLLTAQGCKVIPQQPLPLVYPELQEDVDGLLAQSDLSIHLLGEDYGVVPDKTDKSIICVQEEQAAEKSRKGELLRLVWVSPQINQEDKRQQAFIDGVRANAHLFPNDDIFETPGDRAAAAILEKVKIIEEKRRKKAGEAKPPAPEPVKEEHGPQLIYLICDRRDIEHTVELEDFLYENEFDVILPAFEGEEESLMQDHQENLKSCDAVLIYYGAGNELWVRSITRDLTKIAGYGRTRPLQVKAVFLAPPATRSKERFRSHGLFVINGMGGSSPELLEPFMEMVRAIGKN